MSPHNFLLDSIYGGKNKAFLILDNTFLVLNFVSRVFSLLFFLAIGILVLISYYF